MTAANDPALSGATLVDDQSNTIASIMDQAGRVRARGIAAAYAEIDCLTEAFRAQTGLACPEGCGACCQSPNVEATVFCPVSWLHTFMPVVEVHKILIVMHCLAAGLFRLLL